MTLFDAFRYDGKRVLVVGGATGMGAAAARLAADAGAEVVVMDFAQVDLPGAPDEAMPAVIDRGEAGSSGSGWARTPRRAESSSAECKPRSASIVAWVTFTGLVDP